MFCCSRNHKRQSVFADLDLQDSSRQMIIPPMLVMIVTLFLLFRFLGVGSQPTYLFFFSTTNSI
ncbi:hypothetical protein Hanom_Chr12g01103771 [Helianthus anomalus]